MIIIAASRISFSCCINDIAMTFNLDDYTRI